MAVNLAGWVRKRPILSRWVLMCIPDLERTVRVTPIGRMRIRLRRNRSFWIRDPLTHEGFMLGALQRLIRPGDIVYDVGANIGMYSRFMASYFQARQVVAFEPMHENYQILVKNIRLAGTRKGSIRPMRIALGERDGREDLQVDDVMSASAVLNSVSHGSAAEGRRQYGLPPRTEQVTVMRLDSLLQRTSIPAPQVIKIDIEGAEGMMLRGAHDTLLQSRPKLAIELHGADKAREVVGLLTDYGYACFGYLGDGNINEYRRVTPGDVTNLTSRYDLQHLVAAHDPSILEQPIQSFGLRK